MKVCDMANILYHELSDIYNISVNTKFCHESLDGSGR